MAVIWAICRRDLINQFTTPLAWLVLAAWTLLTNGLFVMQLDVAHELGASQLPLYYWSLYAGSLALTLLAPALTMNSFSAERTQGTMQLLLTVPITEWQLLIGKYLAALGMLLALVAATLVQPAVLFFISDTGGTQLLSGYLGLIVACLFFAALGIWISLLVDSPVAAYVLTMSGIGLLYLVGMLDHPTSSEFLASVGRVVGLQAHLGHFLDGDLRLADALWFLGLTAICLVLGHGALCARRIHG